MFEADNFHSDLSSRQLAALAPAFLLIASIVIACLVDIWRGSKPRHAPRMVWTLVVLSSFPWGPLVYLFVGRRTAAVAERLWPGPAAAATATATARASLRPGDGDLPVDVPFDKAALRTQGLVRDYGGTGVLGVDFAVPERGVCGLVGPNGSGKTTLLAMLAGFRRPGGGTIDYRVDPGRVAICPDVPRFEPWLTAREVVDLARMAMAPGNPASETDRILVDVGLADCADRRVGGFSRGMAQRLGLAVGLVGSPALLIMDEPTAALDGCVASVHRAAKPAGSGHARA